MAFHRAEHSVALKGKAAAQAFFAPCMVGEVAGAWWVAHVDEQVRCIHLARYPSRSGTADAAFPTDSILGDAVRLGSAGLVLASPSPRSQSDLTKQGGLTRDLACVAEAVDVTVLDHLLFMGDDCVSLRRAGLL